MPGSRSSTPPGTKPGETPAGSKPWNYQGRHLQEEDTAGFEAFVYIIRRVSTGRSYIGKKILLRKVTKPPLKGKTRKRRSKVKSDYETYWGSNKELLKEIEEHGIDDFEREVIRLCRTRGESNYWEAKLQFENSVLENPDGWYNEQIYVRVHRSHLPKK